MEKALEDGTVIPKDPAQVVAKPPRRWFDRPKPANVKVSDAEWEWHCYRTRGSLPSPHGLPVVPPWPGVDGTPPERTGKSGTVPPRVSVPGKGVKRAKEKPDRLARRGISAERVVKGLPWGCRTVEEYGREYKRRQLEKAAQEKQSGAPVLRKRVL